MIISILQWDIVLSLSFTITDFSIWIYFVFESLDIKRKAITWRNEAQLLIWHCWRMRRVEDCGETVFTCQWWCAAHESALTSSGCSLGSKWRIEHGVQEPCRSDYNWDAPEVIDIPTNIQPDVLGGRTGLSHQYVKFPHMLVEPVNETAQQWPVNPHGTVAADCTHVALTAPKAN